VNIATAAHCDALQFCNILQHSTTYCNILQHTATYCNILQHTTTYCNILQHIATHTRYMCVAPFVLAHCKHCNCNTLQHTATYCNILQHTATHTLCTSLCRSYLLARASRSLLTCVAELLQYLLQCVFVAVCVTVCVAVCCSVLPPVDCIAPVQILCTYIHMSTYIYTHDNIHIYT